MERQPGWCPSTFYQHSLYYYSQTRSWDLIVHDYRWVLSPSWLRSGGVGTWTLRPHEPYILREHAALLLLAVSFSTIPVLNRQRSSTRKSRRAIVALNDKGEPVVFLFTNFNNFKYCHKFFIQVFFFCFSFFLFLVTRSEMTLMKYERTKINYFLIRY